MGSVTGKCINKKRRKRIVKSFDSWAKEGYIFRQRSVAENVRKFTPKGMQKEDAICAVDAAFRAEQLK
jgi:hypothetical protein